MAKDLKKEIEKVFRTSSSPDDLFDAFTSAISSKIEDPELYKILLWNKNLSPDEIGMYAEKLCRDFPNHCYDISLNAGKSLEASSKYGSLHEKAFAYYKKAASLNPSSTEPYLSIIKMYNKEINSPKLEVIVSEIHSGLDQIINKSKVYFSLSQLFNKIGDKEKQKFYQSLGEKYQREE